MRSDHPLLNLHPCFSILPLLPPLAQYLWNDSPGQAFRCHPKRAKSDFYHFCFKEMQGLQKPSLELFIHILASNNMSEGIRIQVLRQWFSTLISEEIQNLGVLTTDSDLIGLACGPRHWTFLKSPMTTLSAARIANLSSLYCTGIDYEVLSKGWVLRLITESPMPSTVRRVGP